MLTYINKVGCTNAKKCLYRSYNPHSSTFRFWSNSVSILLLLINLVIFILPIYITNDIRLQGDFSTVNKNYQILIPITL